MSATIGGQLPLYAYHYRRNQPDPAIAAAQRADEGTASQKAQPLVAYANGLASGTMSNLLALQSSDQDLLTNPEPIGREFGQPEPLKAISEEDLYEIWAPHMRRAAATIEKIMATTRSWIQKLEGWIQRDPGRQAELRAAIDSMRERLNELQQQLNSYYQFLSRTGPEPDAASASTDDATSVPESQKTTS